MSEVSHEHRGVCLQAHVESAGSCCQGMNEHTHTHKEGHLFINILKNPKAIVQGFFFGIRKNVLKKVIHLKVNEKRN